MSKDIALAISFAPHHGTTLIPVNNKNYLIYLIQEQIISFVFYITYQPFFKLTPEKH